MIAVKSLVKRFGPAGTRNAVNDITFTVPEGKLFTLLGQSGCGKSTTLRMIAGIEEPTGGEIRLGDQLVDSTGLGIHVPVNKRPIGMVFQSYAIWPHMSVYENVSFPLTVGTARPSRREVAERTEKVLETVGLQALAKRSATALSGGQQQRVALARALIREPKVLLLDEPLSNLDAKLREQMREEIRSIQLKVGITTVFVTHDQNEALAISDLILLMQDGAILEFGEPQHIYDRPRTSYGAEFIGISNRFDGKAVGAHEIEFMQMKVPHKGDRPLTAGERLTIYVRPESIFVSVSPHQEPAWSGIVGQRTFQGDSWEYLVRIDGCDVRVRSYNKAERLLPGDTAYLRPAHEEIIVVPQ